MKRSILILVALIVFSFSFFSPSPSILADTPPPEKFSIPNPIKHETFDKLLEAIIIWIRNIALVIAPLAIVYGGFLHITAAGDPSKSSQGKKIILYAAIGLLVVLLAESLIKIVGNFIPGNDPPVE